MVWLRTRRPRPHDADRRPGERHRLLQG